VLTFARISFDRANYRSAEIARMCDGNPSSDHGQLPKNVAIAFAEQRVLEKLDGCCELLQSCR